MEVAENSKRSPSVKTEMTNRHFFPQIYTLTTKFVGATSIIMIYSNQIYAIFEGSTR